MELKRVTKENLESEHICCAISNNNDCQVASKKAWLADRFDDGLTFLKCDVRGKCFIEYIPAENAWAPVEASGYMYIDCLWVSGQFKGQGNSNLLLNECIRESRELKKKGLVVLSSKKKLPFISDPKYMRYKGFKLADEAAPSYELLYLPFGDDAPVPRFRDSVRAPRVKEKGFAIFYSNQCPFPAKYVPLLEAQAKERGVPFVSTRFENKEQAQNAPAPFTAYSMFYDGEFVTNEIFSEKKFAAYMDEKGL